MHYWQRQQRGVYPQKQNNKLLDAIKCKYRWKNCSIEITNLETNHNTIPYTIKRRTCKLIGNEHKGNIWKERWIFGNNYYLATPSSYSFPNSTPNLLTPEQFDRFQDESLEFIIDS